MKKSFIVRELGAYARHGLAARWRQRPDATGPTVVVIHGHGGSGGAFHALQAALPDFRCVAWEYASRGDIASLARNLGDLAAEHSGELHVVAHSLGGIVARVWLQELGGRARVASLTTLSTPHQGLPRLPGARLLPLVREIVGDAPLVARLAASVGALTDLPCLSVVSTHDHFVRPWQGAAFGAARLVPVEDVGHVGVLYAPAVHALVRDHLLQASMTLVRRQD